MEVLKLRLTDELREVHHVWALCEKYFLAVFMFSKERAKLLYLSEVNNPAKLRSSKMT